MKIVAIEQIGLSLPGSTGALPELVPLDHLHTDSTAGLSTTATPQIYASVHPHGSGPPSVDSVDKKLDNLLAAFHKVALKEDVDRIAEKLNEKD